MQQYTCARCCATRHFAINPSAVQRSMHEVQHALPSNCHVLRGAHVIDHAHGEIESSLSAARMSIECPLPIHS
eukprot:2366783-Amphidinium_carterae.1